MFGLITAGSHLLPQMKVTQNAELLFLWLNCVILLMNYIPSVWIYGWGATLIVAACFLDTSVLLTSSFRSWHLCSVYGAVIQWTHLRALGVHVTFRNSSTSHRSPALHMRAHSTALLNWIVSHYNNFDGMSFLFQLGSYQQLILYCCMAPESLNHKLGARFRHNSCWAAAEASPSSLAGLYLLLASLACSLALLRRKIPWNDGILVLFFSESKGTLCF